MRLLHSHKIDQQLSAKIEIISGSVQLIDNHPWNNWHVMQGLCIHQMTDSHRKNWLDWWRFRLS
jgi:hypothetical protein